MSWALSPLHFHHHHFNRKMEQGQSNLQCDRRSPRRKWFPIRWPGGGSHRRWACSYEPKKKTQTSEPLGGESHCAGSGWWHWTKWCGNCSGECSSSIGLQQQEALQKIPTCEESSWTPFPTQRERERERERVLLGFYENWGFCKP